MNIDEDTVNKLLKKLNIKAKVSNCKNEGSFIIYDITLNPGGTFRSIENHSTEIALSLKSLSIPLIYPITKEGIIRMEIMSSPLKDVSFSDIISSREFRESSFKIPLALGKARDGSQIIVDLCEMPHLLIGGSTGSGKSIITQTIINSAILNKNCQLALIDPKRVEFSYYNNIPKLYSPIARDADSSLKLLEKLVGEMDKRFFILEKNRCRDISYYKGKMSYIIVVIDELADLMMASKKETQHLICRLAQKSRACGIHLVVATQRPSVDIITGLIKANFPSRISCKVSSSVDSRTILDKTGAERLSGKGDAIIECPQFRFKRFKGAYIKENDILNNIKSLKSWWNKLWNY